MGLTFSGGFLDLLLFGILQGNAKTSWLRIIPAGIIYFLLYYFIFSFLIKRFNLKTPGREDSGEGTKLYTKADVNEKKNAGKRAASKGQESSERERMIAEGLGGKDNISDVDCCATRLRCTVLDSDKVREDVLKRTGASGVIKRGRAVQIIYGPNVTVIKANFEEYLKNGAGLEEDAGTLRRLYSPFTGKAYPISAAADTAFAEKMMGDGYLVEPEKGEAVAPEDGRVKFVFPAKHAVGMKTKDGIEYLLHIGIDTVKLDGKGFEVFVRDGDTVKKGDLLMRFDLEYIRENAASDQCIVVLTGLEGGQGIESVKEGPVTAGDEAVSYTHLDVYKRQDQERVLSAVCGLEFTLSFIWLVIGVIFREKIGELLGLSPVLVCCLFVYFMFQAVFQCWSLYKRYVYDYRGLIIITLLLTAGSAFFGVFAVTFITPTAEARAVSAVAVSYTHLDVYKRQAMRYCRLLFLRNERAG